jgi:hypothetical protein
LLLGGHYTAYVKNLSSGQWYLHDDSSVHSVPIEQVKSQSAYVLFYKRKDIQNNINTQINTHKHQQHQHETEQTEQQNMEIDTQLQSLSSNLLLSSPSLNVNETNLDDQINNHNDSHINHQLV